MWVGILEHAANYTGWRAVGSAPSRHLDGCKHFHVRPPGRPTRPPSSLKITPSSPAARFLIPSNIDRVNQTEEIRLPYFMFIHNFNNIPTYLRDQMDILGFWFLTHDVIFKYHTAKLIEMYFIYKVSTLACRVTWKWRFSPRCDFYFNPIFPARGETDRSSCAGSGPHLLLESIVESNIATLSPPSRCIDHVYTTFSASVFSVAPDCPLISDHACQLRLLECFSILIVYHVSLKNLIEPNKWHTFYNQQSTSMYTCNLLQKTLPIA